MKTIPFGIIAWLMAGMAASAQSRPVLDFEFFKERVQPIFLKKRAGHARCIACHTHRIPPLVALPAGASNWDESQSRKNFTAWKQFVIAGAPMKSRVLLHPLAVDAGGDHFHAGGKHWKSTSDPEWHTLAEWVNGKTLASEEIRVLQSNSAGDNIHVIDPSTNEVVGMIEGVEAPHGVVIAPNGRRIYVSNEALRTLDVVDSATFAVSKRIPLSGRPNNLDVSPDGAYVYVGIREGAGAVDVIDIAALKNLKSIPVKGEIHNVYMTPDGRHVVAGSIAASTISVIDAATKTLAWTLTLSAGIRPMAFTRNADGSTKEIIVQLSDFHGFAFVDFASQKEIRRITLPDPPGEHKETEGLQGSPSHGLAITPDGKMLWATSKYYGAVAAYSLPDCKLLAFVKVGSHPDWLSIPPDGRHVYVAVAGDDTTVVVDNKTLKVVKTIPVGSVPKRVTSGLLRRK
jgi:YVTN family beta-propeller protein